MAVKDEQGWLLHAGDAYFFQGEVDPVHPRSTPGLSAFQSLIAMDDAARRNNQGRLRDLVRQHGDTVRVFSAHDPTELDAMAQSSIAPSVEASAPGGMTHVGPQLHTPPRQ